MAGTDCGFSTFAGFGKIDENICYEKLHALVTIDIYVELKK